jgi:hypothetical protein
MATGLIVVEFKQDGVLIASMSLSAKDFKTGSKGFYSQGKIEIDGKRYQTQVQCVEIGSKPQTEKVSVSDLVEKKVKK